MTFDEIYEEFELRLRRYAMGLARDSDVADDLVQDTFIRSMGHLQLLEKLNGHQRRRWLFRVLKNLFIDEHRSRQRRQGVIERLGQEGRAWTSDWPELVSSASDLLDLVPARDRELLEQRYVLGMNSREIAHELEIPAATVRSRLHLAIKRLRARKSQFL